MDRSELLASELLSIKPQDLSAEDYSQIGLLLLDGLGTAFAGYNKPWISALHKWAARYDGAGRSGIIGTNMHVPAPVAALVNGTMFHSFELDDTHDASMTHPGAIVISAALSVGSERKSSGPEVMAAIVAGYEAIARVGVAANAAGVMQGGHHATALFGGFASSTAAAKLYRLDTKGLLTAWGHVLSMTAGSLQFSDETSGTSVKRLHAGFPAQNGVFAAELAAAGIDAPLRALDGKYGFLALYGKNPRPELLQGQPGAKRAIHAVSLKPYACCRLLHSVIDGLASLTEGREDLFGTIRRVNVRGPGKIGEQHMLRTPASPMAAQYSLPFVIGATLERGPTDFGVFESKNLSDSQVLRWGDKVFFEPDDELEQLYPAQFGSEVEVMFSTGEQVRERVLDSVGTPARPMSYDAIRAKVAGLARSVDPGFNTMKLETAIKSLPSTDDIYSLQRDLLSSPKAISFNV